MYIGSTSTSTLLDVFKIGISELIREVGMPSEVVYTSNGCKIQAKSSDLSKRVDVMRVTFTLGEDVDKAAIEQTLEEGRIGGRVEFNNGSCTLTIPPFEWRQLPKLLPVDTIVEAHAKQSMRSETWALEVTRYVNNHFNINLLIEQMKEKGASDLHLRAGNRPFIRHDGDLVPMDWPIISAEDMRSFIVTLGGESEMELLEREKESSFQYHAAGVGYLRCSGYIKQGAMALAIRIIPEEPIPFEKLALPPQVARITKAKRGMFLVCGITGSGKSTTLAALVNYINEDRRCHIITTEDPVEFVHKDKQSIVSQRQVGRDTHSFANALRGALREDPDVILVGEMRDQDTIRSGLSAAETGHLLMSTLHTTTAVDTINRIITYFPQSERDLIRQEVAYTLQGVVCQRLLKKIGGGRVPCCEILLGGKPIVRDSITDGDLDKLYGIIENDSDMQSFDQHAVQLFQEGVVDRDQAISASSNEEGFLRIISGIKSSEGRKLLK